MIIGMCDGKSAFLIVKGDGSVTLPYVTSSNETVSPFPPQPFQPPEYHENHSGSDHPPSEPPRSPSATPEHILISSGKKATSSSDGFEEISSPSRVPPSFSIFWTTQGKVRSCRPWQPRRLMAKGSVSWNNSPDDFQPPPVSPQAKVSLEGLPSCHYPSRQCPSRYRCPSEDSPPSSETS